MSITGEVESTSVRNLHHDEPSLGRLATVIRDATEEECLQCLDDWRRSLLVDEPIRVQAAVTTADSHDPHYPTFSHGGTFEMNRILFGFNFTTGDSKAHVWIQRDPSKTEIRSISGLQQQLSYLKHHGTGE